MEATAKPWRTNPFGNGRYQLIAEQGPITVCPAIANSQPDAELIEHAVNNIDRITAERDEAHARAERMRHERKYHFNVAKQLAANISKLTAENARLRKALEDLLKGSGELTGFLLSACDPSNWDAELNRGDYFRGQHEAYEAIQELTNEFIDTPARRAAKAALATSSDTDADR